MRARTTGKRAWPRSKSGRQQLREVEIVALEAVILHLAVAAEVNGVEAVAEALDVALRELRGEFGEHRALQLEPFVGEVAAVMIVVEHHQRPRTVMKWPPASEVRRPDFTASSASVEVLMPLNHASAPGLPPRFSKAVMAPNAIRSLPAQTSLASG